MTRTCDEVKAEFDRSGISIADWARRAGYPAPLVYRVLAGAKPRRGKSHEIAVLLGLKAGYIPEPGDLPFQEKESA